MTVIVAVVISSGGGSAGTVLVVSKFVAVAGIGCFTHVAYLRCTYEDDTINLCW